MRAKIAFLFQIFIISIIVWGCAKDEPDIIPDVLVNFDFNINDPEFVELLVPLGAKIKEGYGYNNNGVIIFLSADYEYKAFDATCPQHLDVNTSVDLNENGSGKATCSHCHTVYYLMNNGYPAKGYKLKQYRTSVNGNFVNVFN